MSNSSLLTKEQHDKFQEMVEKHQDLNEDWDLYLKTTSDEEFSTIWIIQLCPKGTKRPRYAMHLKTKQDFQDCINIPSWGFSVEQEIDHCLKTITDVMKLCSNKMVEVETRDLSATILFSYLTTEVTFTLQPVLFGWTENEMVFFTPEQQRLLVERGNTFYNPPHIQVKTVVTEHSFSLTIRSETEGTWVTKIDKKCEFLDMFQMYEFDKTWFIKEWNGSWEELVEKFLEDLLAFKESFKQGSGVLMIFPHCSFRMKKKEFNVEWAKDEPVSFCPAEQQLLVELGNTMWKGVAVNTVVTEHSFSLSMNLNDGTYATLLTHKQHFLERLYMGENRGWVEEEWDGSWDGILSKFLEDLPKLGDVIHRNQYLVLTFPHFKLTLIKQVTETKLPLKFIKQYQPCLIKVDREHVVVWADHGDGCVSLAGTKSVKKPRAMYQDVHVDLECQAKGWYQIERVVTKQYDYYQFPYPCFPVFHEKGDLIQGTFSFCGDYSEFFRVTRVQETQKVALVEEAYEKPDPSVDLILPSLPLFEGKDRQEVMGPQGKVGLDAWKEDSKPPVVDDKKPQGEVGLPGAPSIFTYTTPVKSKIPNWQLRPEPGQEYVMVNEVIEPKSVPPKVQDTLVYRGNQDVVLPCWGGDFSFPEKEKSINVFLWQDVVTFVEASNLQYQIYNVCTTDGFPIELSVRIVSDASTLVSKNFVFVAKNSGFLVSCAARYGAKNIQICVLSSHYDRIDSFMIRSFPNRASLHVWPEETKERTLLLSVSGTYLVYGAMIHVDGHLVSSNIKEKGECVYRDSILIHYSTSLKSPPIELESQIQKVPLHSVIILPLF
jgi:hypothetical protein